MKVTTAIIKQFESDQAEHGTKIALQNLIWQIASAMLHNIGVIQIKTTYAKDKK